MGFLKKLSNGSNNMFKKIDTGAGRLFKKIDTGINQAGNFASQAGNAVTGVAKQTGNFLEKNSGKIADAAAGLALASGVGAEFAPAIMAAGNSAQLAGSKLKRGAVNTNRLIQNNVSQSQARASDFNNSLNQAVKGALNQGQSTSQNMINQAQNKINNLGDQINGAISSAQNAVTPLGVQIV